MGLSGRHALAGYDPGPLPAPDLAPGRGRAGSGTAMCSSFPSYADRGEGVMADSEVLRAPHVLEYTYTRSVGPVIGAFLTGLRDGRILGARARRHGAAAVIVPPTEYDPDHGATTSASWSRWASPGW